MRQLAVLFVAIIPAIFAFSTPAFGDCTDYGTYLKWIGGTHVPTTTYGVAVSGSNSVIVNGELGVQILDISNPDSPSVVATVDTPNAVSLGAAISGSYAYVAQGALGLQILDISNPASPTVVAT